MTGEIIPISKLTNKYCRNMRMITCMKVYLMMKNFMSENLTISSKYCGKKANIDVDCNCEVYNELHSSTIIMSYRI